MIDYIALSIGHGLLAIAVLRLVFRPDLDVDPLLDDLAQQHRAQRMEASMAGRNEKRRQRAEKREADHSEGTAPSGGADKIP